MRKLGNFDVLQLQNRSLTKNRLTLKTRYYMYNQHGEQYLSLSSCGMYSWSETLNKVTFWLVQFWCFFWRANDAKRKKIWKYLPIHFEGTWIHVSWINQLLQVAEKSSGIALEKFRLRGTRTPTIVAAVWVSYPALYKHFSEAVSDDKLTGKDKAEFKGLYTKLSSSATLMNIALMCGALEELSDLSLSLQAESMNTNKAHRLISRQLEVFVGSKSTGGDKYEIACTAVSDGSYKGVPIVASSSKTDKVINKCQFCQALVDALLRWLLPESERVITNCLSVLFPSTWPSDLPAEYGEIQLVHSSGWTTVEIWSRTIGIWRMQETAVWLAMNYRNWWMPFTHCQLVLQSVKEVLVKWISLCTPSRSLVSVQHVFTDVHFHFWALTRWVEPSRICQVMVDQGSPCSKWPGKN